MLTPSELAGWLGGGVALPDDLPGRMNAVGARTATDAAGFGYARTRACIGVEKGGVGKTFLTINTAAALAARGVRVLLMDLDPQCCATNHLLPDDVEADSLPCFLAVAHGAGNVIVRSRLEGLDLLPARPELRQMEQGTSVRVLFRMLDDFISGQTEYDVFLFDVPPFLGVLASACYVACDSVVLPVTPDAWSVESISLTIRDVSSVRRDAGRTPPAFAVLPNRANPNRRSTGEVMSRLREEYGRFLLPFSVHESAGGLNAMNDGMTVFDRRDAKSLRAPLVALARHVCPPVPLRMVAAR